MRIEIKADNDSIEGTSIILTDDGLNNDNFVELITDEETYMIGVDDLGIAIRVFEEIRERNHQHDLRCKE